MKASEVANSGIAFVNKNRAELLTLGSVVTLWGAIYSAYKAGPKAEKFLEERRKDRPYVDPNDKKMMRMLKWETIQGMFPIVTVPIMLGGMSTACCIGAHTISSKKIATLSAAYTLTNTALREHKDKVREVLGEAKAQQVREAISKDHLEKSQVPVDEKDIQITGLGNVLCYDEYTDRYFYASAESIGNAIVKISHDLISDMWVSLNDFYRELNLRPCKMGEDLGWSIDYTDHGRIPIYYTAVLTEDNRPCLCVQFDVEMRRQYGDY